MMNKSSQNQTCTVVFIDSSVPDYQNLQTGVVEGVKTVILPENKDGIEQITEFLQQHTHITTIHIVSHGSPGCLYLGNSQLNLTNIHDYSQQLQQWQSQNILLYGCNVAAGDAGAEFISKLHEITNATISASATKTGNAALGGNWELEINIPVTDAETFNGTSLPCLPDIVFHVHTLNTYQGVFAATLVGEWDYLSYANAVTVVGNYAYAVGDRLEIIDISNPGQPVVKGSYDISYASGVQVLGNYAYVADGWSGLQIIDISDPTSPTFVGNYDTSGFAYDVQVVGNYAYVPDEWSGLQIINISNPTSPTLVGNYDTSGNAYDVQVVGNYAYVADGSSGLQIIDISDPTSPNLGYYVYTSGWALGVQVVGNYAYVADDWLGLQIIDISDPISPILVGNYDTAGNARDVQVVGNYAYVSDGWSGLQIIDISDPSSPTLVGNYDTSGFAQSVQVIDNYAYVSDGSSNLQIIDISDPTIPTFVGNYDTSSYAKDVQVVGNYAYVADEWSGLQIIDTSNLTSPTLVGNYDTSGYAQSVQVVGNYAYVADEWSGLQIIDISNPTSPTLVSNYDTSGNAYDLQVIDNYAYVADHWSGLQIIDISDPTSPTLVGNYDTSAYALGVQVVGNYAYIADDWSGLQIIDISDPTIPTLVGNYDTSGYAYDVQVVGNYAYVADHWSGLQIIDISDPTAPTLVGNYDTSGNALGVQVLDNYAYIADAWLGLQIIDISDPTAPTLVGNYDTSGNAWGVQVVGNYAYVADSEGGLKIIDISEFINEAPTNIILSTSNITENQDIGTVVGNLTSTDPNTGDSFTYSLVTGTSDTDNGLFTIVGNQLQTNTIFDFETKNSYSILVRTTDQGGLSFEQAFTIDVTDLPNLTLSTTVQTDNINAVNGDNDTITSSFTNLQQNDTINGDTGIDTLIINGGTAEDTISIDTNNIDSQLDIPGTTIINFERFDLSAFIGTVSFSGNAANDWIIAGTGDDDLGGGDGNDYLNGGTSGDLLVGGTGNDTYVVDNTGDVIAELLNQGIDTVESSITWALRANLENLTLTGTTAINGTGNNLNNIITGNTGNNVLTGGAGNDTLIGEAGNDSLTGGAGDDSYYLDNTADTITENTNGGTDSVFSTVTYTLSANVENLTLTGTSAINGTGNDLDNIITGNTGNNVITGGAGADTLIGDAGNDSYYVDNTADTITENATGGTDSVFSTVTYTLSTNVENLTLEGTSAINGTGNALNNTLTGNTGNNVITGGAGVDTLIGGAGDDSYYVDNTADRITENANGGTDSVFSTVTYTLSANVENLTLEGTSAINGTGNDLDNIIIGNTGNNLLTGGLGNDALTGGTGADTLTGGAGNDSYYLDNTGDRITENANQGTDSVFSTVSYTLIANVENLTLQGTMAINGTGNTSNNTLTGNAAANILTGGTGADTLTGGLGNDTLNLGLNDAAVDIVHYASGDGADTISQFVRGVNGDRIQFTGVANIDVVRSGSNTLLRLSDGITGNPSFGTGTLLVTISATSGFTAADVNVNLFGANFLFS